MDFDRVGKYKILGKIGQGAMGEVYKGEDTTLGRYVAVKVMAASLTGDSDLRKRFLREAQSAAQLNHPNIITVYDFGEEHGRIYMAMELLEGRDLKDLIGSRGLSDLHQKLDVMEQVSNGLAFAHSHDIVHRDLKPANIHVQPTGNVKILDFGLARLSTSEMTRTGMVMGTPHYMSPEQVRGEKVDARSDVFSLAAVFYELLSNHKPFDGDSMHTILFKVLQDEPEPLRRWLDVPPILAEVIGRGLAKDPARRLQNGAQLLEAVQAVRHVLAEGREEEATLESELGLPPLASAAGHAPRPGPEERRTLGNVALDARRTLEPAGERTKRPAQTLPGVAVTPAGGSRAAPSRVPIYLGAGVMVLGASALAFFMLRPTGSPTAAPATSAAPDTANEQIGALTQALVVSQVELARKKVADKNYASALAQAERAAKLDPTSVEASKLVAEIQAVLKDMENATEEARRALEAGDSGKASEALWKVLSIDPNSAAAEELAGPLDRNFRPHAEEARRVMGQSRGAAEQAKAGSLQDFADAVGLAGQGQTHFTKGEFAQAARKFLGARDGFDRARRLAHR